MPFLAKGILIAISAIWPIANFLLKYMVVSNFYVILARTNYK